MAYNYPDSPTLNQVFLDYKWDGEKWILAVGGIPVTSALPPPLDGLTGVTGAWSQSRKLLTAYGGAFSTDISGETNVWLDQSGSARNFTAVNSGTRPNPTTAGPNNRACLSFGGADAMDAALINNFFNGTDGYVIASFITNRTSANNVNIYDNDPVWCDANGNEGVHIKNGTIAGYSWDGNADVTTAEAISTATTYVIEWWHTGGNLNSRLNGGTTRTVASGAAAVTGALRIGWNRTSGPSFFSGYLFELAAFSVVPNSTQRDALAANFKTWVGA